ncbi:MAG: hypothetical protein EBS39_10405 [Gammaproteobacteria bacterium]|nr:hypothetical protein [Gammaproteobacteria bacterium]
MRRARRGMSASDVEHLDLGRAAGRGLGGAQRRALLAVAVGAALPDNRTYGVFWMPYEELAYAFDLYGAFNSLTLKLEPGASERAVIAALDPLLEPFGGRGGRGPKSSS